MARLQKLAKELEAKHGTPCLASRLDVRDVSQVGSFVDAVWDRFGEVDILVNNAGGALGLDTVAAADEADIVQMIETNFLGTFRMTRQVLRRMLPRKEGHIVNIGSIAGRLAYEKGAGYCGAKFAVTAFSRSLRLELVESGIRVTCVDPGMAETEFSLVRFKGDREKAKKVYEGMRPLAAQDVADAVLFAVTRPSHVNVDDILITATDQGGVAKVFRRG